MNRWRTAVVGLLFIALVGGLSVVGVAYGFGAFSSSKVVTATIPEAGPALGPGAEVEYRGVLVGSLGSVHRTLRDAVLTLKIQPSQLGHIPAGVTVRLVPRSVFGDLYVDLVPPRHISGPLRLPAHLLADTSTPTVELDQALDAGYRVLTAVRPSELNATLTAIATALDGRGAKLGRLIDQLEAYTRQVGPHTPQLIHDLTTVGTAARELSHDAPDLLRTLDNAIAASAAVARSQSAISKVLAQGPPLAARTQRLLIVNRTKLKRLFDLLRPVEQVLRSHRSNLVAGVTQLRAFLLGAASALGHGPWLQVQVEPDVSPLDSRGYTAADCPRYAGTPGKNCPGRGKAAERQAAPAAVGASLPKLAFDALLAAISLLVDP
ncbi:MAG TPA: MlaD family protein [Mycobacteriales bacterium]|nr:MlaD family protein [Mycobacteriales bacterium]